MSHHSSDPERSMRLNEAMKKLFGEYPDGRLNNEDAGALALMIEVQDGKVVVHFPKPVAWIGFSADQAMDLASTLVRHARAAGSKKPLTMVL